MQGTCLAYVPSVFSPAVTDAKKKALGWRTSLTLTVHLSTGGRGCSRNCSSCHWIALSRIFSVSDQEVCTLKMEEAVRWLVNISDLLGRMIAIS